MGVRGDLPDDSGNVSADRKDMFVETLRTVSSPCHCYSSSQQHCPVDLCITSARRCFFWAG